MKRKTSESIKKPIIEEYQAITTRLSVQNRALEIILHDIKNLIINVKMSSEMIEEADDMEEIQLYNSVIGRNSQAITDLLSEQSLFLQVENDMYRPKNSKLHLATFFNSIHIEFDHMLDAKNLCLQVDGDTDHHIYTDIFCLKSILRNMLKNAIEASPSGNEININCSVKDSFRFSMHNAGAIPEEMKAVFFSRYMTGKNEKENFSPNTGLGTYIIKRMCDVINGTITFDSSKEKGTTIEVSIPLSRL